MRGERCRTSFRVAPEGGAGSLGKQIGEDGMSQHTSLKSASRIVAKRNVLKRFERIDLLRARGKWKEGNRGVGLPKTKPE